MESAALDQLGWSSWFEIRFTPYREQGLEPGRVSANYGVAVTVATASGDVTGRATGRLRHEDTAPAARPVVGDWVAIRREPAAKASIHAVLERKTSFSRKVAGETTEQQVMAANIDRVFVVSALSGDLNLAKLERYLTIGWESGALPVVLLTKADLNPDLVAVRDRVEAIAPGATVLITSSLTGEGLDLVRAELGPGITAVLVGPSGVGKSTLINRLTGRQDLATAEVRQDGKGRHTTTHRQLIPIDSGGMIIDTPGLRELQLWHGDEGIDQAFDDIATLATDCRFTDCQHESEPGCAVQAAIEAGTLPAERLASYRKLGREIRAMRRREDKRLQIEDKNKWKSITKAMRARTK
ncbi:MAG: ribosome small subunit-dependent GTPase A [Candidatus Dormibacteraeota bacterium]|nr:ribosome small subunit-dependent GTPase A [Candidatus Dormibacteraeota bacterium]